MPLRPILRSLTLALAGLGLCQAAPIAVSSYTYDANPPGPYFNLDTEHVRLKDGVFTGALGQEVTSSMTVTADLAVTKDIDVTANFGVESTNAGDPMTGSNWTLLYSGTAGLATTGNFSPGETVSFTNPTAYISAADPKGVQVVTVTVTNPPVDGKLFLRVQAK
jgi:hypothetical protein